MRAYKVGRCFSPQLSANISNGFGSVPLVAPHHIPNDTISSLTFISHGNTLRFPSEKFNLSAGLLNARDRIGFCLA